MTSISSHRLIRWVGTTWLSGNRGNDLLEGSEVAPSRDLFRGGRDKESLIGAVGGNDYLHGAWVSLQVSSASLILWGPRFQERCQPSDLKTRGLEGMTNASLQRGR